MENSSAFRRGYVSGLFHIFHLKGIPDGEILPHYHDFRKIVILLQGNLFYEIEGSRYSLQSGDLVLVEAGELHRPILPKDRHQPYHRIIIYISPDFFTAHEDSDLGFAFRMLRDGATHVLRGTSLPRSLSQLKIPGLLETFPGNVHEQRQLQHCRLVEFLLYLNYALKNTTPRFQEPITNNPAIRQLMQYLTEHLTEPIDIERAAGYVHLDRSYLMHMFKSETGSSIMSYVTDKRLFLAQNLIRQGISASDACYQSGFTNYTSFYRAYRNRYGRSPRSGKEAGENRTLVPE